MPKPRSVPASPANAPAPRFTNLPDPFFVDIREAARRLGFTVWAMRNLCWSKKIRYVRQGRRKFLFAPEDLKAYAEKLRADGVSA
jgi:excisionase family DNA binding protein